MLNIRTLFPEEMIEWLDRTTFPRVSTIVASEWLVKQLKPVSVCYKTTSSLN